MFQPDRISRRAAILNTLAAFFAAVSGLPGHAQQVSATIDADTLAAFVDILLPADDLSPAASALGVPAELEEFGRDEPQFGRLLAVGTSWLNQTGSGPFHALTPGDQALVVDWMSRSDFNQIPRRFFHLVRLVSIELYYARPEAIAGFPVAVAPQPDGYPPPWS
ncbi:MAG: hypothetical protein HKP40_04845 [Litoreibacter sp.]|nr:hypothetical protein [Litoreibacter sp.]